MEVRECTAMSVEGYANIVESRGRGTFISKETRDAVGKVLSERGKFGSRGHISNQQLHPEYVTDYVGILETGFGNTQYQTFWSKLYTIEVR